MFSIKKFFQSEPNIKEQRMKIHWLTVFIVEIILVFYLIESYKCQEYSQDVTHYERPFEKILSRRKRFLIFRVGTFSLVR
jgi:hypothetical protein